MSRESEAPEAMGGFSSQFSGFRVSTEPNRSSVEPNSTQNFLPKSLTKRELRKIAGAENLKDTSGMLRIRKQTGQEQDPTNIHTPNTKNNASGVIESTPYEGYSISSRLLFKPQAAGHQATMTRKEFWKQANPSNISQFPPGANKSVSLVNIEPVMMGSTQRGGAGFTGKDISSLK